MGTPVHLPIQPECNASSRERSAAVLIWRCQHACSRIAPAVQCTPCISPWALPFTLPVSSGDLCLQHESSVRNRLPAGEHGDYFAFSAPSYVAATHRQVGVVPMGRTLVRNAQRRHAAFAVCCVKHKQQLRATPVPGFACKFAPSMPTPTYGRFLGCRRKRFD